MGFEQDYKGLQDYYEARRLNTRIHVIQVLFGAVLVLYLFAFWYLQIVKVDYYRRLSDNNRLRRVTIMPLRGVITDSEHRVLANNRVAFNVRLDREKVTDMKTFFPRLAGILEMPESTLRDRIARYRGRPVFEPVVLKEDVDLAEAAYIESRRLELRGLSVEVESRRNYLYGPLAAHALGYVGEVSEDQIRTDPSGEYELGEIVGGGQQPGSRDPGDRSGAQAGPRQGAPPVSRSRPAAGPRGGLCRRGRLGGVSRPRLGGDPGDHLPPRLRPQRVRAPLLAGHLGGPGQ
ncbi:MAG: hypothetical protein AUG09_02200 [Acidobacteria bacterium 13_1_20CM_2_68_7]|nr:MAG: hypothetical protein AUG09_02200 [Acidobacteria bacterium 13_1_20CM_2_68_7]